MAYVYTVSSCGGILQGDRYHIEITMEKNSMAHVTTQGATRIYGMNSGDAAQRINMTLGPGAYLEFVPDQIIPYGGSRFFQNTRIILDDSATLAYSEVITPGRVAMGESFEYDVCNMRTEAENQDGVVRLVDVANLEPKKHKLDPFGIMGGHAIVGTVYILTKKQNAAELYGKTRSIIGGAGVSGGASKIRDDAGLLIRILGDDTEKVKGTIHLIIAAVRDTCIGAPFSPIRKC